MSALIIPFPGKSIDSHDSQTELQMALVAIDQMHDYRIFGLDAMRHFSRTQQELVKLFRRGEPPSSSELEALVWGFAAVMRSIRSADQFLLEVGHPINL